jgi:signal transduction histidine kinase
MRHKLAMLADGKFSPEGLRVLVTFQEEVAEQVAKSKAQELTALEASDREDTIGDWLEDHGILGAWDYAPTFVEAGLDTDWLERISSSVDEADASASLQGALGWLKYTIDTELMMNQIAEASSRISALLAGAKQYSQMDRAPYQSADVHELLRSTIMMFGDKIGKDKPIKLVKDMDKSLPEIQCYPGDLNQVWTNVIDNAIQAMKGSGTLTIRTSAVGEDAIKVEISEGRRRAHLHAVLHHQAVRRGHRARAGPGVAHRRPEAPRQHPRRVEPGRHPIHRRVAAGRPQARGRTRRGRLGFGSARSHRNSLDGAAG